MGYFSHIGQFLLAPWTEHQGLYLWTVLAGFAVCSTCGIWGNFLILRQTAMLGDSLSHSLLPGIALAFLLCKGYSLAALMVSALIMGGLATTAMDYLVEHSPLGRDAAMGIVASSLFAVGILVISVFSRWVDLDMDCVLFGELAFVGLKPPLRLLGYSLGPQVVWQLGGVLLSSLLLLAFFYKELLVCSFDATYASCIGIRRKTVDRVYTLLLALVIISCFEAVGSLLVVTMLVFPGATASLLTRRLWPRLLSVFLLAFIYSLGGLYLSLGANTSVAGAMGVVALGVFSATWAFTALGQAFPTKRQPVSHSLP